MKKGIEWGYITTVPFLASPSIKGQARTRRLKEDEVTLLLSSTDEYLQHVAYGCSLDAFGFVGIIRKTVVCYEPFVQRP